MCINTLHEINSYYVSFILLMPYQEVTLIKRDWLVIVLVMHTSLLENMTQLFRYISVASISVSCDRPTCTLVHVHPISPLAVLQELFGALQVPCRRQGDGESIRGIGQGS